MIIYIILMVIKMAPIGNDVVQSAPDKNRILLDIKCDKCNTVVKNGILCDPCDKWFHFKCANISENSLPTENDEWKCAKCQDSESASAVQDLAITVSLDSSGTTIANLNKVIELLKSDIVNLKEENERLKQSNKPANINKWEVAPKRKVYRPNLNPISMVDFPPLKNKFEALIWRMKMCLET